MPSHVWLFVTPWTIAHQTPLSMEFFRPENGITCPQSHKCFLSNPFIKLTKIRETSLRLFLKFEFCKICIEIQNIKYIHCGLAWLAFFTYHNVFKVHPCSRIFHYFILFTADIFHWDNRPHFLHPVICWWTRALFPPLGHCEQRCYEHSRVSFSLNIGFQFFWIYT